MLFQVLFLAIYDLLLSKETFFNTNRGYLLSTPILSLIIPLIQIQSFQKIVSQEFIIQLPEIVLSPEKVIQQTAWYQSIQYVEVLFWSGVAVLISFFLVKLFRLLRLIKTSTIEKKKEFTLVHVKNQRTAFSFFNYIFLGKEISDTQQQKVIAHELVHSQQKHSLDLLFFEGLKIVMWFNPMIYIYQKRITLLHEYISDAVVVKSGPKETYINNILSSLFQVENISFVNQFYKQSLIKKRIMMMTKTQSQKMNQLKYLVLIPVLLSMLFYSACSDAELKEDFIAKKELQKMYFNKNGKEEVIRTGEIETFFDVYIGSGDGFDYPQGKEVFENDLSFGEKQEYSEIQNALKHSGGDTQGIQLKIFENKKGRKLIAYGSGVVDVDEETGEILQIIEVEKEESIAFMELDKAPTFPGCPEGDKDCFQKEIQKHFFKNFNSQIANQLGLKSGKNRMIMLFNIDKQGNVAGIKVKAPHKDLEAEAIKVINMLPIMTPGEHDGKTVHVKYTLPIRIDID
jgi:beta-lactamase regulating signal transducer with metallopeptidase domain